METLNIIISTEYHMNQSSVFTQVNGKYVGCLIYPHARNYPELHYWATATSSDSDRGFKILTKEFTNEEIVRIENLQILVNTLTLLIPNQPNFPYISSSGFKIKRGKAYQEYVAKKSAQDLEIKNYFASIETFDRARSKAQSDLRAILTK